MNQNERKKNLVNFFKKKEFVNVIDYFKKNNELKRDYDSLIILEYHIQH